MKRSEIAVSKIKAAKRREKEILRGYRKRIGNNKDQAATSLTLARHVKPTFARMCEAKPPKRPEISGVMLQAAQEIDRVYMALTGFLVAGSCSIEPRSRATAPSMPESIATAHAKRYRPWANRLSDKRKRGGYPALEVVIDLVVDMRSASTIDAERGWRHGTAKTVLRRALMEYAVMAGWAPSKELESIAA